MKPVTVTIQLQNIHCFREGDGPGSAEPYLWIVFFKIDGDTTVIDRNLSLQGTATVIGTPGNQENLTKHGVDAGDDVPIPPELGIFRTVLKPIPVDPVWRVENVGGFIGSIVVLMEEDNTPNSLVATGHEAFNNAIQTELDNLIPKLGILHPTPEPEEIEQMKERIISAVKKAIGDDAGIWDFFRKYVVPGGHDDQLGQAIFQYSQSDLEGAGVAGIHFSERWKKEGDWEISGFIAVETNKSSNSWLEPVLHVMMQ